MFRLPTPRAIWRSLPGRWASHAESAQVAALLAACHALDVAPAPLLEAWARDSRGRQGRRLTQAARHLQAGGPLAAVPDCVPGLMRDEHAVAVRFGGMTGLVVPTVRATLAAEAGAEAEARLRVRGLVRWAVGWSILAVLVTLFLATRIAPQTKKIWDDFGVELPSSTAAWLEACAWLAACRWLVVPLTVMGLVLRFSPAVRQAFAQPFTRRRRIAAALDTLAVAAAAGQPIQVEALDERTTDEFVEVPEGAIKARGRLFALRVKGDSMIDASVLNGDIVVLRHQETANDGDMIAAWIEGDDETTLKYLYREGREIRLQPANPAYAPIMRPANKVRIAGKVVFIMRTLEH